jgi:hypothetical protein
MLKPDWKKTFHLQKTHTDSLFQFTMERRAAVLEIIVSQETDYPPMSFFQQGDPTLAGQNFRYLLRPFERVP